MPGGGGGSKQTTKSTSTSTPYQQDQYGNLLGGADAWLSGGGFDKTYAGGMDTVADMNAGQTGGIQGSYGTADQLKGLYGGAGYDSLAAALGPYDPTKTGLTGAIDAANNRSNYNFETQVNPQIRQGATDAGQYGSSRHGIAEGLARGQLAQTQQDNANTLAFQDQQAFNQNRTNTLNNLSGITKGLNSANGLQYDAGTLEQTQAQNEIQGQLQKWAYENNVSLQDLQAYQSLIQGNMGGTESGQSTTKQAGGGASPWAAVGAVGGAVLGSFVAPGVGTAAGAQLGSMAGGSLSK